MRTMPIRMDAKYFALLLIALLMVSLTSAQPVTITVNSNLNVRAINPLIYGVASGTASALADLNVPLNRQGGNPTSRYNWIVNADNRGSDWYFESISEGSSTQGAYADAFVNASQQAGASAMLTVPLLPYVATLGPSRSKLASFSISKYGLQTAHDVWLPDAGNGISALTSQAITGNNPLDANVPSNSTFQKAWIQHLFNTWGAASRGTLKYFIMDNEPSIWWQTHRDVQPQGPTMDQVLERILEYAAMVKSVDPSAMVVGPEEWGWNGYLYSGADQQYRSTSGTWNTSTLPPDRAAHGGMYYLPWLLSQLNANQQQTGQRLLDFFSVHYYPQGGEYSSAVDTATKLLRNRSTRDLWDPNYVSQSWINKNVTLIPRLQGWVQQYYPGTKIALTEYSWGADADMNGATAQADVLGIFGREGLDAATRWSCPNQLTPTYQAFKMYRNYDGLHSTFGDISVNVTSTANTDNLSVFAAIRSSDKALTIMVVNKMLSPAVATSVQLMVPSATSSATTTTAQVWSLSNASAYIQQLPYLPISSSGLITTSLPPESVTLFVVRGQAAASTASPFISPPPPPSLPSTPTPPTFSTHTQLLNPSILTLGTAVSVEVNVTLTKGNLSNGIVDFEIYNSSAHKVDQQFITGQSFQLSSATTSATQTYSWSWVPLSTGSYSVQIGVFGGGWSVDYYWNGKAGNFSVVILDTHNTTSPSSTIPPPPTPSSSKSSPSLKPSPPQPHPPLPSHIPPLLKKSRSPDSSPFNIKPQSSPFPRAHPPPLTVIRDSHNKRHNHKP
ncbi:hypothetical protein CEUSTIGMA_g3901.t1 [Chlamydomonas eustigma]|uniref:Glycoside hydrolase family 44 catalytic domain-containing protein n=1 Tax=Chlamydomonas eustigma TaxID=1157962 RepID=A0A250X074_9CHLO|nr:hypothetical protein CEUSTIGMA_g3901.t1 [Chlamydomonas eustigma]|eukprot:GAX76456.1 hypothetical protein CEUSTIGMA_g3901.t1 [Chlamydomonas eustigma]